MTMNSAQAVKSASSAFSGAEGAFVGEVPAKETGVHNFTGTKNVELMDLVSPTKLASTIDDQLPPLLSMIIDGLPPLELSKFAHEADKCLNEYVKRYPNVPTLDSYCRLGISMVNYWHSTVINVDCFVAMAIVYALLFMLDDFFFDTPEEFHHDQYGFSHDARESPQKIQEYLDHLDAIFSQEVQPSNPTPLIETLMWKSGQDIMELSNPEWFRTFVASIKECHRASVASHMDIFQGHNSCFQDLESYTNMRVGNSGAVLVQLLIEFGTEAYIPSILRATPYMEKVTMANSIYIGFVNDIFSYHKDSFIEQNPRNLITVLMACEGKPFVQTVHRAIGLVKTHAFAIMDLEVEAWNPTLQNHLQSIKAFLIGYVYSHLFEKRYRHPDSIFPELRD